MYRFEGKVVVITGSSSGIGQECAVEFGKEGASVVIHGQSEERLKQTVKLMQDAGVSTEWIHPVLGSLEDDGTPKKIIDETIGRFKRIDVLVNNAGAMVKPSTDVDSLDNFDYLFKVNLRRQVVAHTHVALLYSLSVVALTQLAIPHLEKTKGNIVNISSAGSARPLPHAPFYAMTKAAMDHYTRHSALQYGSKRIRINSLNPGPIDTIIIERHNPSNEAKNNLDKWVRDTTIMQRLGTTSEMSSIVKFLASDDASYVTGACWNADGGFSVHTKGIQL